MSLAAQQEALDCARGVAVALAAVLSEIGEMRGSYLLIVEQQIGVIDRAQARIAQLIAMQIGRGPMQ
ncbi:hypothetical protein BH09PSE5_BH09PSE5_35510 [soil metagenome]